MTHPPLEVWDTYVPLPAPVGVELFIQPRKETLRFFFFSLCISMREILFEIYFVWFQGKNTPIGIAGSCVLGTLIE